MAGQIYRQRGETKAVLKAPSAAEVNHKSSCGFGGFLGPVPAITEQTKLLLQRDMGHCAATHCASTCTHVSIYTQSLSLYIDVYL